MQRAPPSVTLGDKTHFTECRTTIRPADHSILTFRVRDTADGGRTRGAENNFGMHKESLHPSAERLPS